MSLVQLPPHQQNLWSSFNAWKSQCYISMMIFMDQEIMGGQHSKSLLWYINLIQLNEWRNELSGTPSTLSNCINELARWCLSLQEIKLHGSREEREEMIVHLFLNKDVTHMKKLVKWWWVDISAVVLMGIQVMTTYLIFTLI